MTLRERPVIQAKLHEAYFVAGFGNIGPTVTSVSNPGARAYEMTVSSNMTLRIKLDKNREVLIPSTGYTGVLVNAESAE